MVQENVFYEQILGMVHLLPDGQRLLPLGWHTMEVPFLKVIRRNFMVRRIAFWCNDSFVWNIWCGGAMHTKAAELASSG